MDWIANLIDALARFYDKTGALGTLMFLVIGGGMSMFCLVVFRHSGIIAEAIKSFAIAKHEEVATAKQIVEKLDQQNTILSEIKSHTEVTAKKINDWPSDPKKVCQADALAAAKSLSDEELEARLKAIKDKQANIQIA